MNLQKEDNHSYNKMEQGCRENYIMTPSHKKVDSVLIKAIF